MRKDELTRYLRETGIIYKKEVILRSGEMSNFYCDIKKAYGYPDILNALADEVGKKLSKNVTCIAASGYGGLPLASVVASRFGHALTLVRNSSKDHGKGGCVDGYIPDVHDVCVIIDDVLTTGSSIKETYSVLQEINVLVDSAVVIVKRADAELPIPYSYIFTIEEIL